MLPEGDDGRAVRGICFFFSSRRRHTRYIGDWSSDVCSSDLRQRAQQRLGLPGPLEALLRALPRDCHPLDALRTAISLDARSEERRVGKSVELGGGRVLTKKNARPEGNSCVTTDNSEVSSHLA